MRALVLGTGVLGGLGIAAVGVATVDPPAAMVLAGVVIVGTLVLVQGRAVGRSMRGLRRDTRRLHRADTRRDLARERRARAREVRTREYLRRREHGLFAQLEALAWLQRELPGIRPLPQTRGWAASPDLLVLLVRMIEERRPMSVVEVGSGVSTIAMAARLRSCGLGTLVSLEQDADFAARTRRELEYQGLTGVATVVHAPLAEVQLEGEVWRWYRPPDGALPGTIDLLFVDGPPAGTGRLARFPAVPILADRLGSGAVIVLDDADRPDEAETARRWQAALPGSSLDFRPLESGVAVLTLPAPS